MGEHQQEEEVREITEVMVVHGGSGRRVYLNH